MNKIYEKFWNPLHNYFLPTFKLEEKKRIGPKVHKKFEKPMTPAQKLIDAKGYSSYMKRLVKDELSSLDPIELKLGLEKELKKFYKLLDIERNKQAA